MLTPDKCQHYNDFHCTDIGSQYVFACNSRCGFYMNFNPKHAGSIRDHKTPNDQSQDMWKIVSLALYPHAGPAPEGVEAWKSGPKMSKELERLKKPVGEA